MSVMKKPPALRPHKSAIVTVGQRGTIVIPAELRREMGLECGSTVMMVLIDDDLNLVKVPSDDLERLQWAFGRAYEGKTAEDVERILKELHDEWPD